ncbi:MAG: GLPGLI family protein, partial [Cruoricaptor ignavus]|nr:GLPGLI family protein [Cruoricaptor ignavus]
MKYKFSIICSLFLGLNLVAQDIRLSGGFSLKPGKIETKTLDESSYNIYYLLDFVRNTDLPKSKTTTSCILQIGKDYSRFSDYNTIKSDSMTKILMDKTSVGSGEINEMLKYRKKWTNVLVKQLNENRKNIYQDEAGKRYQYEEKPIIFD